MDQKPNTPRRALEHVAYLCSYNAPREHTLAFVTHQLKEFQGTFRTAQADPRQVRHLQRVKTAILDTTGSWHAGVWKIAQDGIRACTTLEKERVEEELEARTAGKTAFQFRGHDVRIVAEVDMRRGRTLRVPLGDMAHIQDWGHSGVTEVRFMIGAPFYNRMHEAMRDVDYIAP